MKKIDKLQRYIKKHGSITKLIAARKFNEFGLKGKINRLIRRGLNIETVMIERQDKQAYARYTLVVVS